jgi:hypothetical protein
MMPFVINNPISSSYTQSTVSKSKCCKFIYCPKYHCELNTIEGLWCYLKQYVRKRYVQNYLELHNLILEAMLSYQASDLNFKLWKRFWKALNAYKIGKTYEEVLQAFLELNHLQMSQLIRK